MVVPVVLGVNIAEQLAEEPLPDRVQVVELNVPAELLVHETVPIGVTSEPPPVSVTVAVQVVVELTGTEDNVQEIPVDVGNLAGNSSILLLPLSATHRLWDESNTTPTGKFRPFCVVVGVFVVKLL